MQGSEKQVNWADQIKAEFLRKLELGQKARGCEPPYPQEEYEAIVSAANGRTDAKWWIDRRLDGVGRMASNVLGRSPVSNSVF
jgi:hypothetical protein